jgi:hypothetical protein
MRIPETHVCDAAGCTEDAKYRIIHEKLVPPGIPGFMRYGIDYGRPEPLVFEFCEDHATEFTIGGRGAWTTPPKLKPGVP